jgi:hypothetical protein
MAAANATAGTDTDNRFLIVLMSCPPWIPVLIVASMATADFDRGL